MMDLIRECFLAVNLPVTVLLLLVLAYWAMMIVGVVGMDSFDFDLDTDVDLDSDFDGDLDGHGLIGDVLEFLFIGKVPVAIVGTFLVFFMWIFTVFMNHYFNENHSIIWAAIWFFPNLITSALGTRLASWPFASMLKNENKPFTREKMIGRVGIVKSSEVTAEFGQLEIQQKGPPLVLNVRTISGTRLGQGDAAKIVSFDNTNDTFLVELSKWEKE